METHKDHVGKKVRLVRDVDRYPHFVAKAGSTGVINWWSEDSASVRMDAPLAGSEEWQNCILWESDNEECLWDDVEEIKPADLVKDFGAALTKAGYQHETK